MIGAREKEIVRTHPFKQRKIIAFVLYRRNNSVKRSHAMMHHACRRHLSVTVCFLRQQAIKLVKHQSLGKETIYPWWAVHQMQKKNISNRPQTAKVSLLQSNSRHFISWMPVHSKMCTTSFADGFPKTTRKKGVFSRARAHREGAHRIPLQCSSYTHGNSKQSTPPHQHLYPEWARTCSCTRWIPCN